MYVPTYVLLYLCTCVLQYCMYNVYNFVAGSNCSIRYYAIISMCLSTSLVFTSSFVRSFVHSFIHSLAPIVFHSRTQPWKMSQSCYQLENSSLPESLLTKQTCWTFAVRKCVACLRVYLSVSLCVCVCYPS